MYIKGKSFLHSPKLKSNGNVCIQPLKTYRRQINRLHKNKKTLGARTLTRAELLPWQSWLRALQVTNSLLCFSHRGIIFVFPKGAWWSYYSLTHREKIIQTPRQKDRPSSSSVNSKTNRSGCSASQRAEGLGFLEQKVLFLWCGGCGNPLAPLPSPRMNPHDGAELQGHGSTVNQGNDTMQGKIRRRCLAFCSTFCKAGARSQPCETFSVTLRGRFWESSWEYRFQHDLTWHSRSDPAAPLQRLSIIGIITARKLLWLQI